MRWLLQVLLPVLHALCHSANAGPGLSQQEEQLLRDRLFQTNLRGPRWTGNDNQNTLTRLVADYMELAGLDVDTLNYTVFRWDPRWWSLSLALTNGTKLGVPTTGYWPYSGNSGRQGVTAPVLDAGSFGLLLDQDGDPSTLNVTGIPPSGAIIFFDSPSPTHNYSEPGYMLLGTSRNILAASMIPEIGNLTSPHLQASKTLNWTALREIGVVGAISSWVHTSDENGALQFLPNDGAPGDTALYNVPALYVGNATGEMIRSLLANGQVVSAKLVLDAPSDFATTQTVIGHLGGIADTNATIIVYTHSKCDGPSIIEENGPIVLLTLAEYLAQHPLDMNVDFVITTGHMSGHHLNESMWMEERPNILSNAQFAIVCEHFGAQEWKDDSSTGTPVYKATGKLEPMWTMANESKASGGLHESYLNAFEGTPDSLRMALVAPGHLNGSRSMWYGVGGSATLGRSSIPTVGIIPQPDYLWASMVDGGWSKLDFPTLVTQVNVILDLIGKLDARYVPDPATH